MIVPNSTSLNKPFRVIEATITQYLDNLVEYDKQIKNECLITFELYDDRDEYGVSINLGSISIREISSNQTSISRLEPPWALLGYLRKLAFRDRYETLLSESNQSFSYEERIFIKAIKTEPTFLWISSSLKPFILFESTVNALVTYFKARQTINELNQYSIRGGIKYKVKIDETWESVAKVIFNDQRFSKNINEANTGVYTLRPGMIVNIPFIDVSGECGLTSDELAQIYNAARLEDWLAVHSIQQLSEKYNLSPDNLLQLLEIAYQAGQEVFLNDQLLREIHKTVYNQWLERYVEISNATTKALMEDGLWKMEDGLVAEKGQTLPNSGLLPKTEKTRKEWQKAYMHIQKIKEIYRKQYFDDFRRDDPAPTYTEIQEYLSTEMGWKRSKRTVRKVIKAGEQGLLDLP